jgi:hypothetical protein
VVGDGLGVALSDLPADGDADRECGDADGDGPREAGRGGRPVCGCEIRGGG